MTFKELKDIIEEDCMNWDDVMYEPGGAKYNEAWKELETAYEKQIPKAKRVEEYGYYCPCCDWDVVKNQRFCDFCGQKLKGVDQ